MGRKKGKKKRPCQVHEGPRGGRFVMERKKGGGTQRRYLEKGEKTPK